MQDRMGYNFNHYIFLKIKNKCKNKLTLATTSSINC